MTLILGRHSLLQRHTSHTLQPIFSTMNQVPLCTCAHANTAICATYLCDVPGTNILSQVPFQCSTTTWGWEEERFPPFDAARTSVPIPTYCSKEKRPIARHTNVSAYWIDSSACQSGDCRLILKHVARCKRYVAWLDYKAIS